MYSTCCNVQRRCHDAHPVSLWVSYCSKNKERLFPITQHIQETELLCFVEERNKIRKHHSASCLKGKNRVSGPKNGGLHEAVAGLHAVTYNGIILYVYNVKTWQSTIRVTRIRPCTVWEAWNRILNDYVCTLITHTEDSCSVSHR
jgi:hypothetical protein